MGAEDGRQQQASAAAAHSSKAEQRELQQENAQRQMTARGIAQEAPRNLPRTLRPVHLRPGGRSRRCAGGLRGARGVLQRLIERL